MTKILLLIVGEDRYFNDPSYKNFLAIFREIYPTFVFWDSEIISGKYNGMAGEKEAMKWQEELTNHLEHYRKALEHYKKLAILL